MRIDHGLALLGLCGLSLGCGRETISASSPSAVTARAPERTRGGTAGRETSSTEVADRRGATDLDTQGMARDPFQSFVEPEPGCRFDLAEDRIPLGQYSLDDLRLVAVVLGTGRPAAMVIDPTRHGTVLRPGMYVGRREIVNHGSDGSYALHWRVARIQPARLQRDEAGRHVEVPAALVLERHDPLNTSAPVLERVIHLSPGAQS